MLTTLLVGLNGTPGSRIALAQAAEIARVTRGTLLLAHVTRRLEALLGASQLPWAGAGEDSAASPPDTGRRILSEAAEWVRTQGLDSETILRRGDLVQELHRVATDADALVLGRTDGRTGGLAGDTLDIIMTSPVPVMVCASQVSPLQRLAVAYDGGETSVRALSLASRFAGTSGAHLDVVHAGLDAAAGEEALARAAAALSESPVRFDVHFEHAEVHSGIARAVTHLACDGLFVGGLLAARRLSLPSHTDAILRALDIPVLIHT